MTASPIKETLSPLAKPFSWREFWQTAVVLFKLRIVFLLLMAAVGGAFLGARGWPGWLNLLLLIITGGAAAAGASAINQYYERESDKSMARAPIYLGFGHKPKPTPPAPCTSVTPAAPSWATASRGCSTRPATT